MDSDVLLPKQEEKVPSGPRVRIGVEAVDGEMRDTPCIDLDLR
jgi:hypothetical protein